MCKRLLSAALIMIVLSINLSVCYAGQTDNILTYTSESVTVPEINAPSAMLIESSTGQLIYAKNPDKRLHISAACKLMTILVAVENANLSSYITVSSDSVSAEGSALNLEAGSKYALIDLLYAIMLTSANDAAIAVSEYVGNGNIHEFVRMMNQTASKLGMKNTHFSNPTGLYDEDQYTTAGDISLLMKYAVSIPMFNTIYSSKAHPWFTKNEAKILTSANKLFWSYDGIDGGKTGYNNKDQQTIVCSATKMNMKLICIILDTPEAAMYVDATALFDYGFENYRLSTLISKGDVVKTEEFEGQEINLISQNDILYIHPLGESYIDKFNVKSELKAPIKKNMPVGSAEYVLKDGTVINISLYPGSEITVPDDTMTIIKKKITENKDIFYLVVFLAAIEVILVLFKIGKLMLSIVKKSKY
jgi:D-alanyl-D-alanine carboxypeptidase (penicillin-binding protein 5/6)